ncbi:MAG: CDP-alcohol phosphatidyltransferase family protein [Myxococcales bacterium]|nr:CDP-alcohol phosphatidyltransferase family protein [Myxococcales bacterium]
MSRPDFKPRDVEEWIDWHLHRRLAAFVVDRLAPTPITPNQVTLASGAVGLLAGGALYLAATGSRIWGLVAGATLLFGVVLDCADGQLARIRGEASPLGRALDGLIDAVTPTAVMLAMVALLIAEGFAPGPVWLAGSLAGASLLWHASLYDQRKNLFLHASRPDFDLGGDTVMLPTAIAELARRLAEEGRPGAALVVRIWVLWTAPQRAFLARGVEVRFPPLRDEERLAYREALGPVMRATSWLGFGTHLALLWLAAALVPLTAWGVVVAWGVMVGPLNLLALVTMGWRARRVAAYRQRLDRLRRHPSSPSGS